jgi:DNA helicase HerA-like ATPase
MSLSSAIIQSSRAATPLASLINDGCAAVGGIFRLDYSRAIVLTDDWRKTQAGGVPHGAFLLAASGKQTNEGYALDDEELILLRVRGTEALPNESDLVQTRLAVVRDAGDSGKDFDDVTDELTRNELQQSAFDCEVIGTFYTEPNATEIEFGSDIDNVVSSARYQVFLPSHRVLSWIASYPEPKGNDLLNLGVVRFASTRRRARAAGVDTASVEVHIDDFVARKTAVFGMTRTGKSNTIKTLVTAIATHAATTDSPVGQLIFDPQGEYANVNKQDKTGLRLLGGPNQVRVYRMGADDSDPQVFPLAMNFFDRGNFEAVLDFVNTAVNDGYGTYAYVKAFTSINWSEPDKVADYGDWVTWTKAVVGFYGLLAECGISSPGFVPTGVEFGWTQALFDAFDKDHPGLVRKAGSHYIATTPEAARRVMLLMAANGSWNQRSKGGDTPFKFIADFNNRASGKAVIRQLRDFHTPTSIERVEKQIWDDMKEGRVAIVDLAHGSGDVAKIISENIVNFLLSRANERFRSGHDPVPFQIVVEEAHNLFERGAKDVAGNPWVRLSKEAAKYKIGLVYATQEVSSVDQRILSNTSNWLVAHLNSDLETRELSHYYDFKTWAESIRRVEDQGFVRMKTYSGKYIVPVQVAKFDHGMINKAREAAGLPRISAEEI